MITEKPNARLEFIESRVKKYESTHHAALRPSGLRAIADGCCHGRPELADCFRVAADKLELTLMHLSGGYIYQ